MRGKKVGAAFAFALIAVVSLVARPVQAQSSEAIKPYVLVIFDISGSMNADVGSTSSCGGITRIDHAKCAIQQVVDAHADIQFGMGRFRATPDSADSCDACESNTAIDCAACNGSGGGSCTDDMKSPDRFQLLVPFIDDANDAIHEWVNFNCGSAGCSLDPADDPELRLPGGNSYTPLGGALRGAKRFFQGLDTNITSNTIDNLDNIFGAGIDDPIGNDPLKDVFVAGGQQCRPYVVILLTDGAETCEAFDVANSDDDTIGAASALLSTAYDGNNYRIEVKPIGFGISAPNTQIEAMAHAGGAVDAGGVSEGFYADTELELVGAFNQIISDSILVEICDGEDNDCDGQIDEGFQLFCDVDGGNPIANLCVNPGDDCDGNDDNCVLGTSDEVTNACGVCGPLPDEVCNLSDDDCDGLVDEDATGTEGAICNGCTPVGEEICNGLDEDCDTVIDEDIVQVCGSDIGECSAGTETCVSGSFQGCDAVGPTDELCDGLDNDCNGVVDGFVEVCNELPGNLPPFEGVCQQGFQICETPAVSGMGNDFGPCQGEIGPSLESCDEADNDCDGDTDEDTGGADCSSSCGEGTTICVNGVLECPVTGNPGAVEECNGIDDDCDNVIDENVPDPVPNTCDQDGTLCLPGVLQCIGGQFVCTGGEAPGIEVCDCQDNDCDNQIDEEPPTLCPTGSSCVDCQCAFPCQDGEFSCPTGYYCSSEDFCLIDPCFGVQCTVDRQGNDTTCVEGECVPTCDTITCPVDTACKPESGQCVFDDCRGFPELCSSEQFCVVDECVNDLCDGVECSGASDYCFGGECVGSCEFVECEDSEECVLGECRPYSCGSPCEGGRVCGENGECVPSACSGMCANGQICDPATGACIQDPCLGVECPGNGVCSFGSCYPPYVGDAGVASDFDYVSASGGGGCSSSGSSSGGFAALVFAVFLLYTWRRRTEAL